MIDMDLMCDSCDKRDECRQRYKDGRDWMYEDQRSLCREEGEPSYEDDDHWGGCIMTSGKIDEDE
jgi:hypothetical protein